jgi:hypothetical protein
MLRLLLSDGSNRGSACENTGVQQMLAKASSRSNVEYFIANFEVLCNLAGTKLRTT